MPRGVDSAMGASRPEKKTIRRLWTELTAEASADITDTDAPLYLTLAGAQGFDLTSMVEAGLLELTEVGSVATKDQKRFVAVESSPPAVLELQGRYPGLKILAMPIHNLVRSTSPVRWPDGPDELFCRARVVNLDLNARLEAVVENRQLVFPLLIVLAKIAQLHAIDPVGDWSLCLTLHGELSWEDAIWSAIQGFLAENFSRDQVFCSQCESLFGSSLFSLISASAHASMRLLSQEEEQKILMAFLPKKLSQMIHGQGWRVETRRNLRYGGSGGTAPMVSWILDIKWDARASTTPDAVYVESLRGILETEGQIAEDGSLS